MTMALVQYFLLGGLDLLCCIGPFHRFHSRWEHVKIYHYLNSNVNEIIK
jgi:hypothetical protein